MKSTKVLLLVVVVLILVSINPSTAAVPSAQFMGIPTSGPAPLTVTFTDQLTGSPTGWAWYFGDENWTVPAWNQMNASTGWSAREYHSSVVMPDGSIVLMGGVDGGYVSYNDTWRSMNNGVTWTLVNVSSGWSARYGHSSVVLTDGSIVLMGGCFGDGPCKNDTWRSIDNGTTWMLMNASAGWSERGIHTSAVMPDGSIVLMGGFDGNPYLKNDTWRSTDNGVSWTLMNASSGWSERRGHCSVAIPDGSIVLMGGDGGVESLKNDTWRSTDMGSTWALINASSGWSIREYHSSVAMPDGSIILMGGWGRLGWDGTNNANNDTWRSIDHGSTWTLVNTNAEWSARHGHRSLVLPDGSIILMGGNPHTNDVWRLITAGSSKQNPSHIYTKPGTYNVALQTFNENGYNSTRKTNYISVIVISNDGIAIFRNSSGYWYFDDNLDGIINKSFRYGGIGDQIVKGDWDGDGKDGIAIFRPASGYWYFDNNLDGVVDKFFRYGGSTDQIIVGKWQGPQDGIAIFRPSTGYWYFDYNLDGTVNKSFRYGGSTDQIIKGDWDGDGKDGIAIFRPSSGYWYFDYNLDGIVDKSFRFGGSTDRIIAGKWQGTLQNGIAIFRPSTGFWYFDYNLDGIVDKSFRYGGSTDQIIKGDWNGDGSDGIAIFRPSSGYWYFDYNLDGIVDKAFRYGGSTDQIITGKWWNFQLKGTGWILTDYVLNGTPGLVLSGTIITLDFGDDGRITGNSGCNNYDAPYEVKGMAITIGQPWKTLMWCDFTAGDVMKQEGTFLTLLSKVKNFAIEGNQLRLSDANGVTILSFVKSVL